MKIKYKKNLSTMIYRFFVPKLWYALRICWSVLQHYGSDPSEPVWILSQWWCQLNLTSTWVASVMFRQLLERRNLLVGLQNWYLWLTALGKWSFRTLGRVSQWCCQLIPASTWVASRRSGQLLGRRKLLVHHKSLVWLAALWKWSLSY